MSVYRNKDEIQFNINQEKEDGYIPYGSIIIKKNKKLRGKDAVSLCSGNSGMNQYKSREIIMNSRQLKDLAKLLLEISDEIK